MSSLSCIWSDLKLSEEKWSYLKWSEKQKQITTAKQKQNKSKTKTTTTNKPKQHTQNPHNKAKTEEHLPYIYIYMKRAYSRSGIEPSSFCLPTNNPYLAGLHGSDLFDSLLVWFIRSVRNFLFRHNTFFIGMPHIHKVGCSRYYF